MSVRTSIIKTAQSDWEEKMQNAIVAAWIKVPDMRQYFHQRRLELSITKVIHADWLHKEGLEYWLDNFTKDGRTLNVCCGLSEIGDVRLDIADKLKIKKKDEIIEVPTARTEPGDIFDLSMFKDQEFDYVYADPPFRFYTGVRTLKKYRNRWQFELFRLAKKALITRRPKVNINLPSTRHHWVVIEEFTPSVSLLRVDWR